MDPKDKDGPPLYGYDVQTVDLFPEKFLCPVCLLLLRDPVQTGCGHRFCRYCSKRVIDSGNEICPVDHEPVTCAFEDNYARREVANLEVYCSMSTKGCTWTGKLRNVEDHTAVCEYTNVRCPNEGCSEAVHRNQLNHHVTDVCRYTPVPCALCSVPVPQALMPDHIAQECINAEVQCAMCRNQIKRKELVQHTAEDCPNKTVVCPYHQYSCVFEGTREQVDRHCESQKEHHMHLVSQQTKSQEGDATAVPSISELEAAEQEAARLGGTTVIQFLHVAILGAARVGKTSLLKALLEKVYNKNELSTPGMRTSYASTNISADCRFIECPDMPDALSRLYVITMMCKSSTSNHPQDKETTQDDQERATAEEDPVAGTHAGPMEDSSSSSSSAANNRHSQPTAIHQQRDEPAMREEIHETITGFLNADRVKYISDRANTPDYTVFTFRDLGGQQVYQSVQPLFMAKNTTFIATYNSSLDLLETLPKLDELQVSREECIERATLPADATRLDQLLGWLDILLLNAKADSNSTDQSAADDVFVVGCQSDRWNETDLPDPCKLLHEKIKDSPYQNLVWNETSHFKIDNTRSTGSAAQPDELQRLRQAIIDRCQKSQRSIPVPWLRFCISIHSLKQEVMRPWISFEEAKFIAKQVKAVPSDYSDWQIQQLLKYCHEAGHLVYFPTFKLKDTVILDPQFILDCVNAFVYLKPDRHITADEMRRYHSGFMTESLARKALNKMFADPSYFDHAKAWQAVRASSDGFKLIFEILEWLSVLAIVQDESSAEHEFIVPAVVEDMDMHPQTPSCSCAYVSLKHVSRDECMRFPVFLYWQCVVEALLKSRKRSAATLSRCSVRLRWNSEWPWLNLHYTRYGLQVYVECKGRDGGSGKSTLEEVKAIVLTVLRKWNLQAEVISSLPCPCGETSGVECLQHGLSTCCTPSCAHALDASTLVAEDYPLCTRSKPDTQMIREQAKFWLGLDQDAGGMLFDPRSASLPSDTWTSVDSRSGGHGVSGSGGHGVSGSDRHGADGSGVHDSDFMSLGAIGEKTIDLIDDWSAFVSSIEPFIGGEEEGDERAKCGKAAVELVDPEHKNQYTTVLRSFHEMKKGYIRGTGKGENNLSCILLYLMQRPATTVQQLFNLLAASAKHNRRRLFSTIKNAKYLE
ncbi:uncharacterized protein LOC135811874 isoform X2 [Sycon ciliatum]|uniref:uncharacterized protein LOC135811874 isoform X2 n=1 Tax=Sycon ciliatum TaxID=27933 RepID=UPI0031F69A8B